MSWLHPLTPQLVIVAGLFVAFPWMASSQSELLDPLAPPRHSHPTALAAQVATATGTGSCGCLEGDVVLDRDCDGSVVIVSGSTVDLNGFTIHGSVVGSESCDGGFGLQRGITLRNGTVRGGHVILGDEALIDGVHVTEGTGFVVSETGGVIRNSRFTNNVIAVDLYFNDGVTVENSYFENNLIGVLNGRGDDILIAGNTFYENDRGVSLWDEDNDGTNRNVVRDNVFESNRVGTRIFMQWCDGFFAPCLQDIQVTDNVYIDNRSAGILVDSNPCWWWEQWGDECPF
ncbi:MAG: hypothetical protein JRG90_13430, partial [Deltaproteobacteria bacterium]|nr:hypothetical protein [Deltaproteobacteria bacterium]